MLTIWHYAPCERLTFSRNVMLRMTQHMLPSIETVVNSFVGSYFSFRECTLATILRVAITNRFWTIALVERSYVAFLSFCVDTKFDGQSARCACGRAAGAVARRRESTALTFVSECRWAEHWRKEPSALSGENRAALLAEECCQSIQ